MTGRLATLPSMDVAGRLPRLRSTLDDATVDALLVTSLTNIHYLTGFTGSAALLLVEASHATLVTDGRYAEQAETELGAAHVECRIEIGRTREAQRTLLAGAAAGVARLGLEVSSVSWADRDEYASTWFSDAEIVATDAAVETLRMTKDAGEVARIEAAAGIADAAFESVASSFTAGRTEREIGLDLDETMRRLGATAPSFETIVASGPNSARPHARPSDRALVDGDLVVLDFGALVDGYHSDMTRTVWVGELGDEQRRIYETVKAAQAAGLAVVRDGVASKAVDDACRAVITEAGWGDAFVHGTGHGVGLDIHEAPSVASTATATLAAGHVVTVEPGVYLPGSGGVRIEDTVVVTPDGCTVLTRAPKA